MAFPFPRHEDGTLDFEAYDRLNKELRMEAAFDIKNNYPDDLQALAAHLLAGADFHKKNAEAAQKKILAGEKQVADLEKQNKELSYQYDQKIITDATEIDRNLYNSSLKNSHPARRKSSCTIL